MAALSQIESQIASLVFRKTRYHVFRYPKIIGGMRVKWIDEQLQARNLPRKALADAIPGLTETKVSLIMSGDRKLSADEADAIRRFFGYRLPDDPARNELDRVVQRLDRLGEGQIRAVALYLEALMGDDQERQQAS